MNLGLKDRTILVTGSSSGIGRATAIAFGKEGAWVAVTYHQNREGAENTAIQVREAGGQALVVQYDLTDATSIRSSIETIQKTWGALNVLVNNAAQMDEALPAKQLFEDVPLENWQTMLRGTLEGVTLTVQRALPLMRSSGWGPDCEYLVRCRHQWVARLGTLCNSKSGFAWINPNAGIRAWTREYPE